jgi:hypothetical protein
MKRMGFRLVAFAFSLASISAAAPLVAASDAPPAAQMTYHLALPDVGMESDAPSPVSLHSLQDTGVTSYIRFDDPLPPNTDTPEPSTLALGCLGFAFLLAVRGYRR